MIKKLYVLSISLIIFGISLNVLAAEDIFSVEPDKGLFRSPDNWLRGRYDQKASLKRRAEAFLKSKNISKEKVDYLLGVENSLKKVFKDKYWFKGKITDEVFLYSAKNEYESFQLCIIPVKNNKSIKVLKLEISDLTGPQGKKISKDNIKYYKVGYVKTTRSANPTSVIGYWPDPLLESELPRIKPEEVGSIWIEIYTPPDIPAGEYQGEIKIITSNSHPALFKIHLRVWNFTLPKKQVVYTCTWMSLKHIREAYQADQYGRAICGEEMYRKYLDCFLQHKINPINIGKDYYQKDNYEPLDEILQYALEKGMALFEIPRLKGKELKDLCNHLREKGWFDKAMIFGCKDEPEESDYQAQREDSAEIKKIEPKLKIFLTEPPTPELYGAVDIWWLTMADKNKNYIKERIKVGDQVWWYRCGIPVRCEYSRPYWEYPSDIRIDRPSIDIRIFYWMIWKYKMTPATFFWNGNSWPSGYQSWSSGNWNISGFHGINGDGYIVYPGDNGPVPSIRLKCIRDGIEDYEYLYLLKDKLKRSLIKKKVFKEAGALLAIDNSLIVNTHYYCKDPAVLLDYRLRLARMIEKLTTE